MKKENESDSVEPLALKDFVDENHKLLSTIGIFTAITVFSLNIKSTYFSLGLSFLFLFQTLILWSELLSQIPKVATRRMGWFENFLSYSFLVLIIYWVVEYYMVWNLFLWLIIPLFIVYFISVILKKFNLFNILFKTTPGEKKALRHILYWTILIVAYILGSKLSALISPYIQKFLTNAYNAFH